MEAKLSSLDDAESPDAAERAVLAFPTSSRVCGAS